MAVSRLPHGLNESNIERFYEDFAGPVADGASWALTLPEEFRTGKHQVALLSVAAHAGGNPGARTWTSHLHGDPGGTAGVELTTFVESTGVVTIVNRSGGALSNVRIMLAVIAVDAA